MKPFREPDGRPGEGSRSSRLVWLVLAGAVVVILLGLFSKRAHKNPAPPRISTGSAGKAPKAERHSTAGESSLRRRGGIDTPQTAQEIVASKVAQFARSRRHLAQAMAEHFKIAVPDDFERFFDAAEAGRYDEMSAIYRSLRQQRESGSGGAEYGPQWRAIVETQGAADAAHDWPAQRLLDYGHAILESLRPGMIYAGGTDAGCFIPTMLNETTEGERHIALTQNALADGTYLKYLDFLYHDRMATLTDEDSQRAFQDYLSDAQKRLQHDQQFPNEAKQLKPGEDVKVAENRVQVSGQVAVMSINEKLFQMLMTKNPGASFAMEESFPFSSLYQHATILGPLMELGVQDEVSALTAERAAQSVDYWRTAAQQLLSDAETPPDSEARKAYSKLVSSQAGLLLDHKFTAEAEQAFGIANDLCPSSPEAVFRYVNLLCSQNRLADAVPVVEAALKAAPDDKQFQDLLDNLKRARTPPRR